MSRVFAAVRLDTVLRLACVAAARCCRASVVLKIASLLVAMLTVQIQQKPLPGGWPSRGGHRRKVVLVVDKFFSHRQVPPLFALFAERSYVE